MPNGSKERAVESSGTPFGVATVIVAVICIAAVTAAVWADYRSITLWQQELHTQWVLRQGSPPGTFIVDPSAAVIAADRMKVAFSSIAILSFTVFLALLAAYRGLGIQKARLLVVIMVAPVTLLVMTTLTLHDYAGFVFVWVQSQRGANVSPESTFRFAVYVTVTIILFLILCLAYARLMALLGRETRGDFDTARRGYYRMPIAILAVLFIVAVIGAILAFRRHNVQVSRNFYEPMWPLDSFSQMHSRLSYLVAHYNMVALAVVLAAVSVVLLILLAVFAAIRIGRLRALPIVQLLLLMAIPLLLPIPVSRGIVGFSIGIFHAYYTNAVEAWNAAVLQHWTPNLWQSLAVLGVEVVLFGWVVVRLRDRDVKKYSHL